MNQEQKSLLMRANRLLGASLVEQNLVKVDDLDRANEMLLDLIQSPDPRRATLLGVLVNDLKSLNEDDLLHHLVENMGVGLVDLRNYDIPESIRKTTDLGMCWATWSVPIDLEDGMHSVVTAYYLSAAVRTYWQKQLGGTVLWYATSIDMISEYLKKQEAILKRPS